MATVSFSLGAVFAEAFGYNSQAFEPEFNALPARKEYGDYGSPYYSTKGPGGREYFLPVTLTYVDSANRRQDWLVPNCVVAIRGRKTLVETAMTEQKGPFIEFINVQGYEIGIKGFLISATDEFPEADVKALATVFKSGEAMVLECAATDPWLAETERSVVVRDFDFPEVVGVKGVRAFSLNLISNAPFNLEDVG